MSVDPTRLCQFSRREFCSQACQAVSIIALGSLAQNCGGGGNPAGPSGGGGSVHLRRNHLLRSGSDIAAAVAGSISSVAPAGWRERQ